MKSRPRGQLLLIACIAAQVLGGCVSFPSAAPTASPSAQVVSTRLMAEFTGPLLERDGCYLAGKESITIAWPPEFTLERRGDLLRVTGDWGRGEVWQFRIGEEIVTAGGYASIPESRLDEYRVPESCPRDYFVFGGGTSAFQITPEP